jgi:hypothetical protein
LLALSARDNTLMFVAVSAHGIMTNGDLKSLKLGGRTLFRESEVERFINSLDSDKDELRKKG